MEKVSIFCFFFLIDCLHETRLFTFTEGQGEKVIVVMKNDAAGLAAAAGQGLTATPMNGIQAPVFESCFVNVCNPMMGGYGTSSMYGMGGMGAGAGPVFTGYTPLNSMGLSGFTATPMGSMVNMYG